MNKITIASFSAFFSALAVTTAVSEAPVARTYKIKNPPSNPAQVAVNGECTRFQPMMETFAVCTNDMVTANEFKATNGMPACLITIFDGSSTTPKARTILALPSGETDLVVQEAFKEKNLDALRQCVLEHVNAQPLGPRR